MSASDDEEKCDSEREGDAAEERRNVNGVRNMVCNRCREGKREEKS